MVPLRLDLRYIKFTVNMTLHYPFPNLSIDLQPFTQALWSYGAEFTAFVFTVSFSNNGIISLMGQPYFSCGQSEKERENMSGHYGQLASFPGPAQLFITCSIVLHATKNSVGLGTRLMDSFPCHTRMQECRGSNLIGSSM